MDLAVRWVLDQPGITAALWGARHPGELEAVAGALDWKLDRRRARGDRSDSAADDRQSDRSRIHGAAGKKHRCCLV